MGFSMILKSVGAFFILCYVLGVVTTGLSLNKTEKALRIVCSLYIIFTCLTTGENLKNTNMSLPETDLYSVDLRQSDITNMAEENLKTKIEKILNENSLSYNSARVHIFKQNEEMKIGEVIIGGANGAEKEIIESCISPVIDDGVLIFED